MEDAKRAREIKIASTYKLNSIEDFADIVDRESNAVVLSIRNAGSSEPANKPAEAPSCKYKRERVNYQLTKVELDLPETAEKNSDEETEYEDDHFLKSRATPIKSPSALKGKKNSSQLSKCPRKDKEGSRVKLYGHDQLLIYENEKLQESPEKASNFQMLGGVLNKNSSKTKLARQVKMLPEIQKKN